MGSRKAARRTGALASATVAVGLLVALAGCEVKESSPNLVNGKKAFVGKCGSCHVLARAESKGTVGPNLDQAFQAAIASGMEANTVEGVVYQQILDPRRGSKMPDATQLKLSGATAQDIAAYVAVAAAQPGKDAGALATAGAGEQKPLAKAKGGKLVLDADPSGQLLYVFKAAEAPAGSLEVTSKNASSTPHNIALEGPGVKETGKIVQGGGVSEVSADLKSGTYEFLCTVPGHADGGMKGKLTVK